jgi:dTDP-4-amino-4,6-dideoxygalactose transaminase
MKIPLTKPYWGKEEEKAVIQALRTTSGSGDGTYSAKIVARFKEMLGVSYVYPVTSCTHGLELAVAALGVGAGDEVIVPSFTLSSTANCVFLRGATPVIADIERETYGIDPEDTKRLITTKTKGIIVVHYAGMPCKIEAILALARKSNLWVVEDAAHAIGATYKGKPLGTFGDAGAFSFHGTKNVCCGEGGITVTNNKQLAEKMDIFRAAGTNRSAFMRHEVALYTWVGEGTSFFMSDLLAAVIDAQLDKLSYINVKRQRVASVYSKALEPYAGIITLPRIPVGAYPNWHIYAITFRSEKNAKMFLNGMREKEIGVATHYVPLHSSPMGKKISGKRFRRLPVVEKTASTLVRLPIYPALTLKQLHFTITNAQRILDAMIS